MVLHQSILLDAVAELLNTPIDGLPEIVDTPEKFESTLTQLAKGHGGFAFDAERASGYRYSARAYLIQIKREGGGLHLIDPIPFGAESSYFKRLNQLIAHEEIILHASTQDLPCLRELGINPTDLFDTELAGRIAGLPRVGLGALTESLLDITLAKEHSAVDWSIRPLPEDWLNYAALDVDLLFQLRNAISELLESQGKLEWALQEFSAILKAPPPVKREDPWRRTSGMHKIKKRPQLAMVRELWLARDAKARELDIAPGRLLSDSAISLIATAFENTEITTRREFEKVLRPLGIRSRWLEHSATWLSAIAKVKSLPESQLPEAKVKSDSLPHIKVWREKFPERYIPLSHARALLGEKAAELEIPVENLVTPEFVRRICWMRPEPSEVERYLAEWGARLWQIEIAEPILVYSLAQNEALVEPELPVSESSRDESSEETLTTP